jgi:hypothetical protein
MEEDGLILWRRFSSKRHILIYMRALLKKTRASQRKNFGASGAKILNLLPPMDTPCADLSRSLQKIYARMNERGWDPRQVMAAANLPQHCFLACMLILPPTFSDSKAKDVTTVRQCLTKWLGAWNISVDAETTTASMVAQFERQIEPIYDDTVAAMRIATNPARLFLDEAGLFVKKHTILAAGNVRDDDTPFFMCGDGEREAEKLIREHYPTLEIDFYYGMGPYL